MKNTLSKAGGKDGRVWERKGIKANIFGYNDLWDKVEPSKIWGHKALENKIKKKEGLVLKILVIQYQMIIDENIHTGSIIWTEQCIFIYYLLCVLEIYVHMSN